MAFNQYNMIEELVVFLRNQDILTIGQRGVTTTSQNFTGDGSTSTFTVNNSASIKNVRTVTINGSSQVQWNNFTTNYEGSNIGRLTFASIPALNATITVSYDYGSDKIYPDLPRVDLDASSYPRISCDIIGENSNPLNVEGTASIDEFLVSMNVYDFKKRDVMNKVNSIRTAINSNRKNFQTFNYIRPSRTGPVFEDPNRRAKVLQQSFDTIIPLQVENV